MLWQAARAGSRIISRSRDDSNVGTKQSPAPIEIGDPSTSVKTCHTLPSHVILDTKIDEKISMPHSQTSSEPSPSTEFCDTTSSLSAQSTTFSISSAFEESCGGKGETEDDIRIVKAFKEEMDWSFPFLLRRGQVLLMCPTDDNDDDLRRLQKQDNRFTLRPREQRHSGASQPTDCKIVKRKGQDQPQGSSEAVASIKEGNNSAPHVTQSARKAGICFRRIKSAQLGPESLRSSYFHHNTLRRHNSTDNFSRARLSKT